MICYDYAMKIIIENENIKLINNQNKWIIDTSDYHIVLKDNSIIKLNLIKHEFYEDDFNLSLGSKYQYQDGILNVLIVGNKINDEFDINIQSLKESELEIEYFNLPGTIYQDDTKYIIPYMQGIIFDSSEYKIDLAFNGSFASCAAYLNMIGIMANDNHSLVIVDDYVDAYYKLITKNHKTQVALYFKSSLNKLTYTRKIHLLNLGEYSQIIDYAKAYRKYIETKETILSLKDKLNKYPFINNLIGSCVIHTGIHTIIREDSYFYDKCDHEYIRQIKDVKKMIEKAYKKGVNKIHLHLDGCGLAYDNEHPNFGMISSKTGGYEALNDLKDYLHEHDSLITIHDNYRDLYKTSSVYNEYYSIKNSKQEIDQAITYWAGGRQEILCASKAMNFFLNNMNKLKRYFKPDGVYTDVFTCNPMDECFDYNHLMTRKECLRYRKDLMQEVLNEGMISSSEEVNIGLINEQITAHYAPYPMMMKNERWDFGINIPFFTMVFHDCLIIPWMMDYRDDTDFSLFAILNGGIPYLKRDGAYPNTDGSFGEDVIDDKRIERCKLISDIHSKIAFEKVSNFMMSKDGTIQTIIYGDKLSITINLNDNKYELIEF